MSKRSTRIGLDLLDVPSVDKEGLDPQFMAIQDHSRMQFDFQNERMPTFDFMNNTLGPHNQQGSEIEARTQKVTASAKTPSSPEASPSSKKKKKTSHHKDKEKSKDKGKEKNKDKDKGKDKDKDKEKDKDKDKGKDKDKEKEKEKDKDKGKEKDKGKVKDKEKKKEKGKDKDSEKDKNVDDTEKSPKKSSKKHEKKPKKKSKDKTSEEKPIDEKEPQLPGDAEKEEDLTEITSVPPSPLVPSPVSDKVLTDLSSIKKPQYEKPKKTSMHSMIIPPSQVQAEHSTPTSPVRPITLREGTSAGLTISSEALACETETEDEDGDKHVEELKEKKKRRHKHKHRRKRKEKEILLVPSPSTEPSVNSSPGAHVAPLGSESEPGVEQPKVESKPKVEPQTIPAKEQPDSDKDEEMLKMPSDVPRPGVKPETKTDAPSSDSGPKEPVKVPKRPKPALPLPKPSSASKLEVPKAVVREKPTMVSQDLRRTISLEVEQSANHAAKKGSQSGQVHHDRVLSLDSSPELLQPRQRQSLSRSFSHGRSLEEQLKELIENPKAGRLAGSKIKTELPPSVIGIHELRHAIGQSIRGQPLPSWEGMEGRVTAESMDTFFTVANSALANAFKRTQVDERNFQILKRNLTDKINVTEKSFGGVNENVRVLSDEMGQVSVRLASSQERVGASEETAEKIEKGMMKMKKLVIAEADPGLHFDVFLRKILLKVFAYVIWFCLFFSRMILSPFLRAEDLPPAMSVNQAAKKIQRAADQIEMNRLLECDSDETKRDYC